MSKKKKAKRRFKPGDYIQYGSIVRIIHHYSGDLEGRYGDPINNYCFVSHVSGPRGHWNGFISGWIYDNTTILTDRGEEYHWELASPISPQ